MRVILADRSELIVSDQEADQISKSILKSTDGYMKIGDQTIKKTRIVEIRPGGVSQADIPSFASDRLPSGKICTGSHSIQNEINQIIRTSEPKNWAKVIRDNAGREEIRQELLSMSDEWCDYKTNKCICA